MRRDWLNTRFGINFAAIGIVAVLLGGVLVALQDIWFVATGASPTLWLYDKVSSYLAAGVAAVFSAVNFFVFRPGLPKFVAVVLAISFASYVAQPLVPIHVYREVAALCIARTAGLCTLLLLARIYFLDLKAGKAAQ